MAVKLVRRSITTRGHGEILDVTGSVAEAVRGSGIANGIATVFVTGSTAPSVSLLDAIKVVLSHEIIHITVDVLLATPGTFDSTDHVINPDEDADFIDASGVPHGTVPDPDEQKYLMHPRPNSVTLSNPHFSNPTRRAMNVKGTLTR